jgi:hypothetical protein
MRQLISKNVFHNATTDGQKSGLGRAFGYGSSPRQRGPMSYRLFTQIGSTGSLLGFTVLVAALRPYGLTRLMLN